MLLGHSTSDKGWACPALPSWLLPTVCPCTPGPALQNWGALQGTQLLSVTGCCQTLERVTNGLLLLGRDSSEEQGVELENATFVQTCSFHRHPSQTTFPAAHCCMDGKPKVQRDLKRLIKITDNQQSTMEVDRGSLF